MISGLLFSLGCALVVLLVIAALKTGEGSPRGNPDRR